MYPSPFCNLSRRHWMCGGVQVGCGASGWRAAPGGDRCRRSPRRTRNPPASLPGTLGDGPTGKTPPGNPPPDSGALCVRQRLHGIPRGLEGEELRGVGVVLSQLHEQDSKRAGLRGERALFSPSDRGIRDGGDCQARCRSSQPKIRFRTSGRSWAASIRLSRLDGTAPAADWEPDAWQVMGYGVTPSLTRRRTVYQAMLLRPDERCHAARPRWYHKAEETPSGLV